MDKPSRSEAPNTAYLIFDNFGVVDAFDDEDKAYETANDSQRVVTYTKA